MQDKRINLITDTSRKGKVFKPTATNPDMNSLLANDVKVIKWIMALIGTLQMMKHPTTIEHFRQTSFGDGQCKELTGKEFRKLAAWWAFVLEFQIALKSKRGKNFAGAAIALIQQEAERANYALIKNPLTSSRAGLDHEDFERVEGFIEENWRNLIN